MLPCRVNCYIIQCYINTCSECSTCHNLHPWLNLRSQIAIFHH